MICIVKSFSVVSEAEIDVFLELSCFSYDPTDVGNLISGSSAFSKTNLNIWKFMVHILLKPGLDCMQVKKQQLEVDIEHQTGSKLGKEYIKEE